jgi:putative endopeptidase
VRFGTWGVDLSTRDLSVKPGDDFQRYANGTWMDTHDIPADKSQNGIGSEVNDRNQEQLRAIVMDAPRGTQLGAFYASYMDEPLLDRLDAAPLKPDLDRVGAISSRAAFTRFMAGTLKDYGSTLFGVGLLPDPADPRTNIGYVISSGMGMPDRDYYLLEKYAPQRAAYRRSRRRSPSTRTAPGAFA